MFRPLINLFIHSLPLLRFNKIKIFLYKCLGYDLHYTVRISSSAKILGAIKVKVGKNTFIGHETFITGGQSRIIIGSDVDISSRVAIVSGTHEIDMENPRTAGKGLGMDIQIQDGVWIGFGAIIMPGVTIGYKSIIGAGAVVNKNVPPFSIAAGNPCKVIKTFDPVNKIWIKAE